MRLRNKKLIKVDRNTPCLPWKVCRERNCFNNANGKDICEICNELQEERKAATRNAEEVTRLRLRIEAARKALYPTQVHFSAGGAGSAENYGQGRGYAGGKLVETKDNPHGFTIER